MLYLTLILALSTVGVVYCKSVDYEYEQQQLQQEQEYDDYNRERSLNEADYGVGVVVQIDCPCMNNGLCVLENDFCVCPPDYTGRYCEIRVEKDNQNGCGDMLNTEEEYLDCAKCRCSNNMITCYAIKSFRCDLTQFMGKQRTTERRPVDNYELIRDSDLSELIELMKRMETSAYDYYIDYYAGKRGFTVVYKDMNNPNDVNDLFEANEPNDTQQKIIALKSNGKLIGLYFRPKLTLTPRVPVQTPTDGNSLFSDGYSITYSTQTAHLYLICFIIQLYSLF